MKGFLLAGLCGVLFALSGNVGVSELVEVSRADVEGYYAQWQSSGLRTYSMTFQWSCFCFPCFRYQKAVTVTDNEVSGVDWADGVDPLDPTDCSAIDQDWLATSSYASVCDLFELILDSVDTAASTQVEFDADLPFPKSAYIDHNVLIADEETAWSIGELTYDAEDLDFDNEACGDGGTTEDTPAPEPTRRRKKKKKKHKHKGSWSSSSSD